MQHAVSIVTTSAAPTAVVKETTTWERYPTLWRELLDEVWSFVRAAELQAGRNVMLYADDVPNVEVGVEMGEPFAPGARVVASMLPAGRAATTAHRGRPRSRGWPRPTPRSSNGAKPTATPAPASAGRSTTTGATTPPRSRPPCTGYWRRDARRCLAELVGVDVQVVDLPAAAEDQIQPGPRSSRSASSTIRPSGPRT